MNVKAAVHSIPWSLHSFSPHPPPPKHPQLLTGTAPGTLSPGGDVRGGATDSLCLLAAGWSGGVAMSAAAATRLLPATAFGALVTVMAMG